MNHSAWRHADRVSVPGSGYLSCPAKRESRNGLRALSQQEEGPFLELLVWSAIVDRSHLRRACRWAVSEPALLGAPGKERPLRAAARPHQHGHRMPD